MRGGTRVDAAVAAGFVLAATAETAALHRTMPGLLAFGVCGAPVLAVLAVRRTRPVVTVCVIAGFAVLGMAVQALLWPHADDSGGVWMLALMLACYSLGAHGRGRIVSLGGLLPLLVVLTADLPTMSGWALANGVLFVSTFVGVLPTVVGRTVRVRRDRLDALREQRDRIVREQRAQRESAVLAERLRTTERLQPDLLDGLRALARSADAGADPGLIETTARQLLTRTREEVVALTAPVPMVAEPEPPVADPVRALRATAQPWVVIAAGAVAAGLALESTATLALSVPGWVAVLASLAVGVPLALVWWRPLAALTVAWCAVTAFSRLVAPLDGTLSEAALALSTAFAVAALSTRWRAVAGLLVCWIGEIGVGPDDPFGVTVTLLVCWLGGLAVNEVCRLVEQSHTYNLLLAGQEAAVAQRAVVDERLRLARELHDQIGHSLTVVALQAGAARRLGAADPERSRELLLTIAAVARNGVDALDTTDTSDTSDTSADLAALLDRTRAAGLVVAADITDAVTPGLLDSGQRAVAHRLVQEALTNVLRHAPGAHATVAVRREGDDVVVIVANSAPSHPGTGAGNGTGLAGIRERVTARAGKVSWGPRADGGFEVLAVLPAGRLEGAAR